MPQRLWEINWSKSSAIAIKGLPKNYLSSSHLRLRSSSGEPEPARSALHQLLERLKKTPNLDGVRLLKHVSLAGDLCLLLWWQASYPQPWGSAVGLRLAEFLREYGLVDHNVWVNDQAPAVAGS